MYGNVAVLTWQQYQGSLLIQKKYFTRNGLLLVIHITSHEKSIFFCYFSSNSLLSFSNLADCTFINAGFQNRKRSLLPHSKFISRIQLCPLPPLWWCILPCTQWVSSDLGPKYLQFLGMHALSGCDTVLQMSS